MTRRLGVVLLAFMTVLGGMVLPDVAIAATATATSDGSAVDPQPSEPTVDAPQLTAPTPGPEPSLPPDAESTQAATATASVPNLTPSVLGGEPAVLTAAIEGQVLGWMDPLGGATVTVYDADTGQVIRSITADGNGDYRIGELPAGPVKVGATRSGWLPSFANGRHTLATADVFTLVGGETLRQSWDPVVLYIDLTPEAVIEGTVRGDGAPLADARVSVLNATTGQVIRSVMTDASGHYRIGGLAQEQVKLRAAKAGWTTVYANGQSSFATADTLPLLSGQTLSSPWLDLVSAGSITGSVLGINDNPDTAWDGPLAGVRVSAYDAATGQVVRSVETDAYGTFRIDGLEAGGYKLRAAEPGWLTTWGIGKASLGTADVFQVVAGQTTRVGDEIVLWAEAAFEGQVLGWNDPLDGVTVAVLDAATGRVVRSVMGDGSGFFRVGGLPAGQYKVRASRPGWVTGYADNTTSLAAATVFTLVAGQTLTQDWDAGVLYLELRLGSVVQGQVLGLGVPLAGARVSVLDAATGRVIRSVMTDATGSYRIDDLDRGLIKVRASKPGWSTTYADGEATLAGARVFAIEPLGAPWAPVLDLTPEGVVTSGTSR